MQDQNKPSESPASAPTGYVPIYVCFFGDGELVGFTKTAEHACEWAGAVAGNNKSVRIIKIYEITTGKGT